ncbi:MAG: LemA family protein [Elusimicrobia bacterium RBG_16_66_12]|nr:MAG: LemA family protein [Elusimicrobia bacterium RBG_16_66_12]
MKILGAVLGALALVVVVTILWAVGVYNGIVGRNEAVSKAWATVESQYQRRLDLIPNLVETVKGSAKFEKETLSAVVEARSRVGSMTIDKKVLEDPASFKKFEEAQAGLSSALSRLMVVVEKYPDIKSTQGFRDLQVQLEGTENRIAVARNDFNAASQDYNTAIKVFPGALVAGFGGFKERPYFSAAPGAAKAPSVKF